MYQKIDVKLDGELIKLILVHFNRNESIEEFINLIEYHVSEAVDCKDNRLLKLSINDLLSLLNNKEEVYQLANIRKNNGILNMSKKQY